MSTAQKRAIQSYRARLGQQGLTRFEVIGRDADRELIRSLARQLAEDGAAATHLRRDLTQRLGGEPPRKGGILEALLRSPLVNADLNLTRADEAPRAVDL